LRTNLSKSGKKINVNPASFRKDASPSKMQCNLTKENNSEHFLSSVLTNASLGSVLEAELGIRLKPDSPLTSQYLITAE